MNEWLNLFSVKRTPNLLNPIETEKVSLWLHLLTFLVSHLIMMTAHSKLYIFGFDLETWKFDCHHLVINSQIRFQNEPGKITLTATGLFISVYELFLILIGCGILIFAELVFHASCSQYVLSTGLSFYQRTRGLQSQNHKIKL